MSERSISKLVKDIGADAQALAQEEAALAKSEALDGAKNLGIGAGLAIGALFLLFLSSFMAMFTVASALHEGLGWAWWLSFLVVFGGMVLIALILVAVALPLFKKGNPTPTSAIASGKSVVTAIKRALSNPGGPRY